MQQAAAAVPGASASFCSLHVALAFHWPAVTLSEADPLSILFVNQNRDAKPPFRMMTCLCVAALSLHLHSLLMRTFLPNCLGFQCIRPLKQILILLSSCSFQSNVLKIYLFWNTFKSKHCLELLI